MNSRAIWWTLDGTKCWRWWWRRKSRWGTDRKNRSHRICSTHTLIFLMLLIQCELYVRQDKSFVLHLHKFHCNKKLILCFVRKRLCGCTFLLCFSLRLTNKQMKFIAGSLLKQNSFAMKRDFLGEFACVACNTLFRVLHAHILRMNSIVSNEHLGDCIV